MFFNLSLRHNLMLPSRTAAGRLAIRADEERRESGELLTQWRIKSAGIDVLPDSLSGGNQQKVVLAKWLSSPRLRVLILDHPTRGLDVGAKEDVYRFVRQLCSQGIGIVLIADTLEETIALSHSIIVMRDGEIQRRFDAAPGHKPAPVDLVEEMV